MASQLAIEASESLAASSTLALEASPVAIALTDLSGRIAYANPAFHALFGLSPAITETHPDVSAVCAGCSGFEFLERLARDGQPRQLELTLHSAAGASRRLLCNSVRVEGEGGMPKWLSLSFMEIAHSESLFGASDPAYSDSVLVEKLVGAGSWRISLDNSLDLIRSTMKWSPALCAFFNTRPTDSERTVQHYLEGVHLDDRARVMTAMRATISSNVDYIVEYRKAGTTRIIRSRGTLLRGGRSGSSLVLAGIDQDVTQEYQRDQQQRREAQLLKSIIDTHEAPVYAVDRQLCFVGFNAAYITAQTEADRHKITLGVDVLSVVSDTARRKQVAEHLRRALKGEQRIEDIRAHDHSTGSFRRELVYSPMLGTANEVIGVAVFSRDIQDVAEGRKAPVRSWRRQERLEPMQSAVALIARK